MDRSAAGSQTVVRRLALLVALYAIPAIAAVGPVLDPDVWMHLRTGQWIIEHGWVPTTDPFSTSAFGKPWVAYSWLFELLIYGFYRAFGLTGLVVYTAVMLLLIAVVLHALVRRYALPFVEEIALLLVAFFGLRTLAAPRPWLFTILFFAVELDIILTMRRTGRTRPLWLLPPLFALWANLHIQFVIGLFILGLAAVEPIVARALRLDSDEAIQPRRAWMLVLAACGIATFATPYHVFLYREIAQNVAQAPAFTYIDEFRPLALDSLEHWAVMAITLTAVFLLGWSRHVRLFALLLLLTGIGLSFRASRDAWVVDLVSVAIIAMIRAQRQHDADRFSLTPRRVTVVASATLLVLFLSGLNRHVSTQGLSAALAERFPVAASTVVEERRYDGPLYNQYNWGAYFIWRLPRLPVSIDGRAVLYGNTRVEQQMKTWAGGPEWASDPDLSKARLVILPVGLPLTSLLRLDGRFELAYEDHVAVVFTARR